MLVNDLALLLDLFGNSERTKLLIYTIIFCLVFTAPEKWRVELRAKTGHYRNRCLLNGYNAITVYQGYIHVFVNIKLDVISRIKVIYLFLVLRNGDRWKRRCRWREEGRG